ncbi:MAG: hypothetical protein JXO72_16490 [Vicinamibacteria bacterium]|nr:hypothetical protein [Vicinamibacteria bacterium]
MLPETLSAGAVRDRLLAACEPIMRTAFDRVRVLSVPEVRASVLVQPGPPLRARVLAEGPQSAVECLRLEEADIPAREELNAAVDEFVSGGLSGLPESVFAGALEHASLPGAGFVVWIRPDEAAIACLLCCAKQPLSNAVRLFSIEASDEEGSITCH